MGGYVTQSRNVEPSTVGPWSFRDSFSSRSGTLDLWQPSQVTTSWRTGRTGASAENDERIPTSNREAFRKYRKEYKESERPLDNGHPFDTELKTRFVSHPHIESHYTVGGIQYGYSGPLVPDDRYYPTRGENFPVLGGFSEAQYGPKAIAVTTPTNPVAGLAVALGELKHDGLPALFGQSILKDRGISHKNLSDEYLNHQFGWKPLVSDIAKTMYAVSESSRLLQQYQRDSGRVVRRRFTFPDETSTQVFQSAGDIANVPNSSEWTNHIGNTKVLLVTKTYRKKIWFSGAYGYYLQKDNSTLNRLKSFEQKANHLLGTRITPDTLWQLEPWSWLVDWQTNLGYNIQNASLLGQDGLVIRYGYLMCHEVSTFEATITGAWGNPAINYGPVTVRYQTERKIRRRATPFGFATNPGSFTGRQWAILAALGLTRTPGDLRTE